MKESMRVMARPYAILFAISLVVALLARIGLGIAFIPDFCLPDNDPELFKLTMSEVFPSRQLVVGYNDKLPISEAVKYFIESLNADK